MSAIIREPAVAGAFYPSEPAELDALTGFFLKEKTGSLNGRLHALIVPHAGYVYSGLVAGKGFVLLSQLDSKTDFDVLLLGPSHTMAFAGCALYYEGEWRTPRGKVRISPNAPHFISDTIIPSMEPHRDEHCLEVQVPFLQKTLKHFHIVPMVCGSVDEKKLADELIAKLQKNSLLIISSDLSHYLPYAKAIQKDRATLDAILNLNIEKMESIGDACGKTPILVLMHIARALKWKPVLQDYRNSGDTAGDKKRVVGYASIAFVGEQK